MSQRALLKDNETLYDIGLNRGQTLLKARAVDSQSRYVGVDPLVESVAFANRLYLSNDLGNCQFVCTAIGDGAQCLTNLAVHADFLHNSQWSSIVPARAFPRMRKTISELRWRIVPSMSLDQLHEILAQPTVGIVKIDVEGAELEVLIGAKQLLAVSRPILLVEILPLADPSNLNSHFTEQQKIWSILRDSSYIMYRVTKGENGETVAAVNKVVDWPLVSTGPTEPYRDYILVPEEKTSSVLARLSRCGVASD